MTEKDYNGNVAVYTYDTFGRKQTIQKPPDTNPTEVYSYENFGIVGSQKVRVLLRKDSASQTWKETYFDGLGRTFLTKKEGLPGKAICTATSYNDRGLVSGRSLPYFEDAQHSYWTYFDYDALGRQTKVTPPDGKFATMSYDKRKTSIIDANKHKKIQEKDPYGNLIKVEEYQGIGTPESPYSLYATTTYEYDVLNNLVKVIDAAGNQTTMVYDTLLRKVRMTDPDMCSSQDPNICYWAYVYDPNGNLLTQTDAKNQTIVLGYYNPAIGRDDPLNRIMKKEYPNGSYVAYTYDQGAPIDNPKGRLTSVADASGTVQYFYDGRGRTKKTIKTVDGQSYEINTGYDSLDRIVSITYPDQEHETIYYDYDAAGNLFNISGGPLYATYSNYTPLGQPGNIQYGNGVSTAYAYDVFTNRLTDINTSRGQALQSLSYYYDDVGNVKEIKDGVDSTRKQQFQYDHLNRLVRAESQSYPNQPQGITYLYNGQYGGAHPHAATQAGPDSYTYDNNGNMLTGAGRTIAYDYENRPSSISLNGVTYFVYDYQGKRVKKIGSSTTVYIGDLYECTGGSCMKHIFAGSTRVASRIASPTTYYYHTDHLGSSNVITDVNGAVVEEIYYFPYGATRLDTGSVDVSHKYTGQEEDAETGLYYYGARYYDPALARFISPDSIVPDYTDPQSLNRYSYVLNNPLIYIDPTGNQYEAPDPSLWTNWYPSGSDYPYVSETFMPLFGSLPYSPFGRDIIRQAFTFEPGASKWIDEKNKEFVNGLPSLAAGFGDSFTKDFLIAGNIVSMQYPQALFAMTSPSPTESIREYFGWNDVVDKSSGWYTAGKVGAYLWEGAFSSAVGGELGVRPFIKGGENWHAGLEFPGKLNLIQLGNDVREGRGIHIAFWHVGPKDSWFHLYLNRPWPWHYIRRK